MSGHLRRPLLITGPPAVGKSHTARTLALSRTRAAYIDVDDVRQLVVAGAEAIWRGPEGSAQGELASRNACALARNFLDAGFEVTIADVLTPTSIAVVRQELPTCLVVRLVVDLPEARRRAATRQVWLTDEEFQHLHDRDRADPPAADVDLDVTALDLAEQCQAVERLWGEASAR